MKSDVVALVETTPAFSVESDSAAPPFALVPIADLAHVAPEPPSYAWEGLVPFQHVTVWTGHGGGGKSTAAKMLCVAACTGHPLFGIPTAHCKAAFFSAEDGANLLSYRLLHICRGMGVDIADLDGRMFILDATANDPTLYAEVTIAGRREGATTRTYDALCEFVRQNGIRLLIVDNASDAYDASEIERAKVRGFMRSLAKLARELDAAVILLAHVDKNTSRGLQTGAEGYSGSTAWHNSARSRLFMSRDKDGAVLIEQQKHNLGPLHEPLRLVWPKDGLLQLEEPFGPVVQGIADRGHERAILRLIVEFSARGEHVSTATTSRSHAGKLLRREPSFPSRMTDSEVFDILRRSERAGNLERATYKGTDRKERERWEVTDAGYAFAGLSREKLVTVSTFPVHAATAATAATPNVTALNAEAAEPCGDCGDFAARGCGGKARTQESPQRPGE